MPLDAVQLGTDLYNVDSQFNENDFADIENARLQYNIQFADAIINHFISHGALNVPGLGLMAGSISVTGNSVTGTIS